MAITTNPKEIQMSHSTELSHAPDQLPSPPTIETLVMHAMDKGISADSLAMMVAQMERVADRRAKEAFNQAMSKFKSLCPALKKNKIARDDREGKGNRVLYRYADLGFVAATVDPILMDCGLSYTFSMKIAERLYETTCIVKHIEGHQESATFTCPASGTSIMSEAQKVASATTYGRRYALIMALGLSPDLDDDGASIPGVKPDAVAGSPKVAPRSERTVEPANSDPNRVTSSEINSLMTEWAKWPYADNADPSTIRENFLQFARATLGTKKEMKAVSEWTREAIDACREKMRESK